LLRDGLKLLKPADVQPEPVWPPVAQQALRVEGPYDLLIDAQYTIVSVCIKD
jgi:hypothetical protein